MKLKLLFFALLFPVVTTFGQGAPGKFRFQAALRDANGDIQTTAVTINVRILRDILNPVAVYTESHPSIQPTIYGIVNLNIGDGLTPTGTQPEDIDWAADTYSIEITFAGNTTTQQLVSVPYALHANKADSATAVTAAALANIIPAGTIVAFGGTAVPTGWALCNGDEFNRTTESGLFAAIGINYGDGNGSSTFNVPDFQGKFLRGVDNATGNDPDVTGRTANGANIKDAPGSTQDDKLKDHQHTTGADITASATFNRPAFQLGNNANSALASNGVSNSLGGNETRPKNVYVNYIIKK